MNKVISSLIYFLSFALNYKYALACLNDRQLVPFHAFKNNIAYPNNSTITLSNVSNARILHKDLYLNRKSKFCHIKCDCFFSHSTKNEKYDKKCWS